MHEQSFFETLRNLQLQVELATWRVNFQGCKDESEAGSLKKNKKAHKQNPSVIHLRRSPWLPQENISFPATSATSPSAGVFASSL